MRTGIRNGIIITPQEVLREQALIINDKTIERIGTDSTSPDTTVIDAKGCYVVPGFIDVHVHGADGYDTMDATPKAIQTMGAFYAKDARASVEIAKKILG